MPTRVQVLTVIDAERAYQQSLSVRANRILNLGDHKTIVRYFYRLADETWAKESDATGVETLSVLRQLTSVCIRAMEQVGVVYRNRRRQSPATRTQVYEAVSEEATAYASSFGDRSSFSIGDYLTRISHVLFNTGAVASQPSADYEIMVLESLRRVSALAVLCMEQFGVPQRTET